MRRGVYNTEKGYKSAIETLQKQKKLIDYELGEVDKHHFRFETNKNSKGKKFVLKVKNKSKKIFFKIGIDYVQSSFFKPTLNLEGVNPVLFLNSRAK